ncbi:hypothetical protein Tco_1111058 [Tanacetum coccineum]|uniref:Uncharacterized protein n=1 Tax=Tanacetum coccineum TaxID=301880 RepID=A0ABQ5IKK2_9ASTR
MAMNTMLLSINLKSQRLDKEKQEVKNIVEQATKCRTRITESLQNFTIIHKKSSIHLNKTPQISPVNAIPHDLPTEEPEYSLSMGDKHLDTIPETESDEVIKSSVENLVPIPSESEDFSDNESECDVPVCDESSPTFTTFSNPLFDSNDDFTTRDDESFSHEDVPMEKSKIYSNPLFDEEITSAKIDTPIVSSPKIDSLFKEFSDELAHIDPIPPGIEEANFDLEEEIRLVENLSYDNSSPRPPEELNAEIADTIVESLSPPLIPVEDSDSCMEEIDLFVASDDSMPPGIENDDYDSERDIRFLEELLSNGPLPLPENESSNFDHHDDPSFPRPPSEPPDVEIRKQDFDLGIFIEVQSERLLSRDEFSISFIRDPLYPVFDTLLQFSSENEDKVFKPGILSYLLVSHQDKITSDFSENPMMMYEGDIPLLDIPNSGVTCEEEAKRRNSGAKTKKFEEVSKLLPYAVSNKEGTAWCMTRSSTKELLSPLENPERILRSRRKLFDNPSLMTRDEIRSGAARPTIDTDIQFELKGQFLKELRDNTFSGLEHEDANEHIEKVLKIVDLFHIPKITQDQLMLRAFPVSLTGAASLWLRNEPAVRFYHNLGRPKNEVSE